MLTTNITRQRVRGTKLNRHPRSHSLLLTTNVIDSQWYPLTVLNKHYSQQRCQSRPHLLNNNGCAVVLVLLTFMASDNRSSGLWDGGKAVSYCSCCFTACCTSNCTSYLHNWWSTWERGGGGTLLSKIFLSSFQFLFLLWTFPPVWK